MIFYSLKILFMGIVSVAIILYVTTIKKNNYKIHANSLKTPYIYRLDEVVGQPIYGNCSSFNDVGLVTEILFGNTMEFIESLEIRKESFISNVHPFVQENCQSAIAHFLLIPGHSNDISPSLNITVTSVCMLHIIDSCDDAGE